MPSNQAKSTEDPAPASAGPTILIVDDEDDLRESLAELLEEEGYRVEMAPNGLLGLTRLQDGTRPSVVLLDIHMPLMTGVEVFAAMRDTPALAGLPVVFMTSDPSRAPAGVPIVKKPVDLRRLLALVGQLC